MRTKFFASVLALPLLAAVFARRPRTPIRSSARWKTFDDETGKPMSITEVYQHQERQHRRQGRRNPQQAQRPATNARATRRASRRGHVVFWDLKAGRRRVVGRQGLQAFDGDNFKVKTVKASADGKHLEVDRLQSSCSAAPATGNASTGDRALRV